MPRFHVGSHRRHLYDELRALRHIHPSVVFGCWAVECVTVCFVMWHVRQSMVCAICWKSGLDWLRQQREMSVMRISGCAEMSCPQTFCRPIRLWACMTPKPDYKPQTQPVIIWEYCSDCIRMPALITLCSCLAVIRAALSLVVPIWRLRAWIRFRCVRTNAHDNVNRTIASNLNVCVVCVVFTKRTRLGFGVVLHN